MTNHAFLCVQVRVKTLQNVIFVVQAGGADVRSCVVLQVVLAVVKHLVNVAGSQPPSDELQLVVCSEALHLLETLVGLTADNMHEY